MKFTWVIEPSDIEKVKALLDRYKDDYFVKRRRELNLQPNKPTVQRDEFWRQLVACLLTTVQRSGPTSFVAAFLRQEPFPLTYQACIGQADPEAYAKDVLTKFGGIRRTNIIPKQIAANLGYLKAGTWQPTCDSIDRLRNNQNRSIERETADFMRREYEGLGPKQSRNLLQSLGLTRYEIPIDSRITDWLVKLGFPFPLPAKALADAAYYVFVMDRVQELCQACDVVPCILDASIFTSYDKGGWNE